MYVVSQNIQIFVFFCINFYRYAPAYYDPRG